MADPGFPGQHTTTTTVTTSNTTVQTNIRFDPLYIRTTPGLIKCAQIILCLLIFISVASSVFSSHSTLSFMSGICGLGFWLTGVLMVFYLFHIIEKFYKVPWLKIEFVYTGIWTLFLIIGSSVAASHMSTTVFGVVSFFGYVNMCVYGYDCFLKFKAIQNGEIAQGTRQVSKTTNDQPSPAAY